MLSLAPLVALGRISYGVYLLHWPIFLWLNPTRVRWAQWPLFGLRVAVTLVAAAMVMFRLLETPIRSGPRRWSAGSRPGRPFRPRSLILLVHRSWSPPTSRPVRTGRGGQRGHDHDHRAPRPGAGARWSATSWPQSWELLGDDAGTE